MVFFLNLYVLISGVSDLIVYTDNQINLSTQRMSFLSLFIASKFPFQFQILLLQKGEICKVDMHPNETV